VGQDIEFYFNDMREGGELLEKCQITGKEYPKEDTVEFLGFRVGVEGKLELLRRLKTGAAFPGEMEAARFGPRFVALLVDGILIISMTFLLYALAGISVFSPEFINAISMPDSPGAAEIVWMNSLVEVTGFIIVTAYYTVLHGMAGQTVGKMAMRIKVVNQDGTPLGYRKAFMRFVAMEGPYVFAPFVLLLAGVWDKASNVESGLMSLFWIWFMVDAGLALADREELKSLHDRLATTRVILK